MVTRKLEYKGGFQSSEVGLIPSDWKVVKLKEIAERLKAGGTPLRTVKGYWNGNIPFVKIEDITSVEKYLTRTASTISEEGLRNSSAWLVPPKSILLSMYASIGEVAINKVQVATNQAILAIIPKKEVDVEYLYYCLKYHAKRLHSFIVQTTQKNVNKGITENLLVPVPPLAEQRKIAFVLSKIQQAIQQQDKIIEATKNLKKSLMQKLFTEGTRGEEQKETEIGLMPKSWKVLSLSEIVEKTAIIDPRKNPEIIFKYIDVSSISREYLIINEYKEYKGRDAPSRARKAVKEGDIIFATVRPSLKRIAIIPESFDGEICSTAFCVIRCKKDVALPEFVFYYILTDGFVKRVSELQKGTNYPAVTDSDVLAQKIPLPKISEQQQIVESLSMVDRKMLAEERRKVVLQQLFKTTLNKLMTGEIRVKDIDLGVINVS